MQVVILAGGKGTRLGAMALDTPKALVPIAGKPILTHQLEVVRRYGLSRILILTGHLGERIAEYYGDGSSLGLQLTFLRERSPLGTAGAVKAAESLLEPEFLVIYGDILFDMNLRRLIRFHYDRAALGTLVVHPNDHPHDSDLVDTDEEGRVRAFIRKDRPVDEVHRNLVNAGIYCLDRSILQRVPSETFLDFGLDVFPSVASAGVTLVAYNSPEYLKDVGTLSRHARVEKDILSGKVRRHNLDYARPAVFLDRDGVLNADRGDACTAEELELLPGVPAALARLNKSDHLAVVVTNQPGIAKGFLSSSDVERTHAALEMALGETGAWIDRIYYCPHHPERGFPGERSQLKIVCSCRKPEPGMVLRAADELNIDLSASFIVGDRTVDVEAGQRAGVATVMVSTGHGGRDAIRPVQPDFHCDDLASAVDLVLNSWWLVYPARELAASLATAPSGEAAPAVAIGGLSRSGKTTLATLLAWQLRRRGKASRHLRLDDYLLPTEQRAGLPSVRQRYNYDAIARAVPKPTDKSEILIIEGTIALDVPEIRDRATYGLFLSCDEVKRRERFLATYLTRGESLETTMKLYEGRDREEREIVTASAAWADTVLIEE